MLYLSNTKSLPKWIKPVGTSLKLYKMAIKRIDIHICIYYGQLKVRCRGKRPLRYTIFSEEFNQMKGYYN